MTPFLILAFALCAALAANEVRAQATKIRPRLLLENLADLQYNGRQSSVANEPFKSYLRWLVEDAEASYWAPVVQVGTAKYRPPGAQWNDFVSMAPYWWPDPSKPDGLPYMKRDGYVNPEVADYPDKGNLVVNVGEGTINLAYAWYFARWNPSAFPRPADEYARRAIQQLRVWFVDPNTRMNPNMQFAQIRPGHRIDPEDGATGILDLSREIRLVEAISILSAHPTLWDRSMTAGMRVWMTQMLGWLENSPSGKKAAFAGNNLGIYYSGLVGIMKLYLGQRSAASYIRNACNSLLNSQVRPSGEMPAETGRSDSLHYTFFALEGFLKLAILSDKVQPGGKYGTGACWTNPNFKRAMAYPLPAVLSENPALWPHRLSGSRGFKPERGWELFYAGWLAWGNKQYKFGDAQYKWARKGGVGNWGRVFYPEPSTRVSIIGRASWMRMLGVSPQNAKEDTYKQRSAASLPVGAPRSKSVGKLAQDSETDFCHGLECRPFKMEDGSIIYAATSVDDYGA